MSVYESADSVTALILLLKVLTVTTLNFITEGFDVHRLLF